MGISSGSQVMAKRKRKHNQECQPVFVFSIKAHDKAVEEELLGFFMQNPT